MNINLRKIFAHAAIILSGMILVFLFIDRVNTAMAFINNDITKWLIGILCVISVLNSIMLLCSKKRKAVKR